MSDFRARRRRLLAAQHCDAVLVSDPIDVRYLTGLASSNAAVLIAADRTLLITDARYETPARAQLQDMELVLERNVIAAACERASTGTRIAFDSAKTSLADFRAMDEFSLWWEERPNFTAQLRAVKDEIECATLRAACAITAEAMTETFSTLRPGMTEREIAAEFEQHIRDRGASGPSFSTIVAVGENSAVPHHEPTDRALAAGEIVLIDAGALVDGYHADMTRCAVLGAAAGWQRELAEQVRDAQELGVAAMRRGASDVDALVRERIAELSGTSMPHGTGHGVGLEIHEAPIMTSTSTYTIPEAAVMTVEPGIYLPGRGGIRIEDTGIVRSTGFEVLTIATKDLLEIG